MRKIPPIGVIIPSPRTSVNVREYRLPENNIIPEKNQLDEDVLELLKNSKEASLNTPPLDSQPEAIAVTETASAPINEKTGLTTTETALLSPLEQSIRLKQRA